MYQAAICEDEEQIRSYIRDSLAKSFEERNIAMAFDTFSNGQSFLNMFETHLHYDVIFMDIEMPGIDGIEVCRRIRSISPDSLVIFISNKDELVFQTFEVQPFRFIRKSQYFELLPTLTDTLITELQRRSKHIIQIIEPGSKDIFSFDINAIVYIEAQGKYCNIITKTQTSKIHCKLMDLEQQLQQWNFLKPHRSYLVNCQYVYHISKSSIILTNHEEIPISRNRVEEIKKEFLVYTSGGMS